MKRLLLIAAVMTLGQTLWAAESVYDFKVKSIDGREVNLAEYKGKPLVIVNTASKCGYTPQYEALEALYTKYKAKGVTVLGFPSNDFGGQEPGTDAEIKHFCQAKYNVDFPMFDKGPVTGDKKQPLYQYLTDNAPEKGAVKWNFEKFIIGADGKIAARFRSATKPDDPRLTETLDKVIAKK